MDDGSQREQRQCDQRGDRRTPPALLRRGGHGPAPRLLRLCLGFGKSPYRSRVDLMCDTVASRLPVAVFGGHSGAQGEQRLDRGNMAILAGEVQGCHFLAVLGIAEQDFHPSRNQRINDGNMSIAAGPVQDQALVLVLTGDRPL